MSTTQTYGFQQNAQHTRIASKCIPNTSHTFPLTRCGVTLLAFRPRQDKLITWFTRSALDPINYRIVQQRINTARGHITNNWAICYEIAALPYVFTWHIDHWGQDKGPPFWEGNFQMYLICIEIAVFRFIFDLNLLYVQLKYAFTGSDHDLAPNRWHAIIWASAS